MGGIIAAIVTLGTLFLIVAIIFQVEQGKNTPALITGASNINNADVHALFST